LASRRQAGEPDDLVPGDLAGVPDGLHVVGVGEHHHPTMLLLVRRRDNHELVEAYAALEALHARVAGVVAGHGSPIAKAVLEPGDPIAIAVGEAVLDERRGSERGLEPGVEAGGVCEVVLGEAGRILLVETDVDAVALEVAPAGR